MKNNVLMTKTMTKTMKLLVILISMLLTSCGGNNSNNGGGNNGGNNGGGTSDAADTATWSVWSQWAPENNANTSVIEITQTRMRTCSVTVIGSTDTVKPTCSGGTSETRSFTNPLAADTATWSAWSQWTPENNADTSMLTIEQVRTRTCEVMPIGDTDTIAVTCNAIADGNNSQTQIVDNPLAASADTAAWIWSDWTPTANVNTNIVTVEQTRSSSCVVTVIGVADNPAPSCTGATPTSQNRTIDNPLATDTATWSDWSQWTPENNANTSVIEITQTRMRTCSVTVMGSTDTVKPTCSGGTSETRSFTNPLATDTATWSVWSQWTPENNANTSVIEITQTRMRTCSVTVIGSTDTVKPTCSGGTSETRSFTNPLAADTAAWSVWSQWTPENNADTSMLTIEQVRTRTCEVMTIGDTDTIAVTCNAIADGNNSQTQIVDNPLAASADTAAWIWSDWTPTANVNTNIVTVEQTRSSSCIVTVIGVADNPAPGCTGATPTSQNRTIDNPLATDTAAWIWSDWTPTANVNTNIVTVEQTRSSSCIVTVIGVADNPAPSCTGATPTSQNRTIDNPLAASADTAIWSTWSQWSPAANTDTQRY